MPQQQEQNPVQQIQEAASQVAGQVVEALNTTFETGRHLIEQAQQGAANLMKAGQEMINVIPNDINRGAQGVTKAIDGSRAISEADKLGR